MAVARLARPVSDATDLIKAQAKVFERHDAIEHEQLLGRVRPVATGTIDTVGSK